MILRSAKELVRHVLHIFGADDLFDRLRSKHAVKGAVLKALTRRERFTAIYEQGLWQHAMQGVPGSGQGSSLNATANVRSELPDMLNMLQVETLLDLGCGDFTWMRMTKLTQNYVGVDVVPSVIESNRRNFSAGNRTFFCVDVGEDDLPEGDAVLCREILFHLSFSDISAVLRNCARKPRRYLLATTDNSTFINAGIRTGDFRRLNLRRHPFSFPEPDYAIRDDAVEKGRIIGIWRWERLPIPVSL